MFVVGIIHHGLHVCSMVFVFYSFFFFCFCFAFKFYVTLTLVFIFLFFVFFLFFIQRSSNAYFFLSLFSYCPPAARLQLFYYLHFVVFYLVNHSSCCCCFCYFLYLSNWISLEVDAAYHSAMQIDMCRYVAPSLSLSGERDSPLWILPGCRLSHTQTTTRP